MEHLKVPCPGTSDPFYIKWWATSASALKQQLDRWECHQYDFHWHAAPVSLPLVLCRKYQQDAMKANWGGLVARTDGSDDVRMERMGAGYAIGD